MNQKLKKGLIYLLATMMVLPASILAGPLKADTAKADGLILNPVVTEVYVNGNNDWVEVYNPSPTESINLSGFKLKADRILHEAATFSFQSINLSPREIKVISKDQFNPVLNLSDDYSWTWQVEFLDPTNEEIQNDLNYGFLTGRRPSSDQSLQFNNVREKWEVVSKNPGDYDENFPDIEILRSPSGKIVDDQVNITLNAENADEIWYGYSFTIGDIKTEIGKIKYSGGCINLNQQGIYEFVAQAQNELGQYIVKTIDFTIDWEAPKIILPKVDPVEVGTAFTVPEPTVTDNLDPNPATIKSPAIIDTDEVGEQTITYTATDWAGNKSTAELKINVVDTAPSAPLNVKASASATTVNISWDASPEADVVGYNIQRDDKPKENLNKEIITGTTYADLNVVDGTYSYSVQAVDKAGNISSSGKSNTVIVDNFVPVAPIITAVSNDSKTINITWQPVAGDDGGYWVYVSQDKDKLGVKISVEPIKDNTAKTIVADYATYYVQISAIAKNGNQSTLADILAKQKIIAISAPVETHVPTVTPPVVTGSVVPQKAQAAVQPQPVSTENGIDTPDDSQGQIKGTDDNNEEEDSINWVPWIILLILILLAGAATGGYFYWFAGQEEIEDATKKIKSERPKNKPPVIVKEKSKKKDKRW